MEDQQDNWQLNWCDVWVNFADITQTSNEADGVKMSPSNYTNKEEFESAATELLTLKHGVTLKGFRYALANANFNPSSLVSTNDISAHLWDLLALDTDGMDTVLAYYDAFDIDPMTFDEAPKDTLNRLNETGVFQGYYYSLEDFAEKLMREQGIVRVDNHYFVKSKAAS